jgi:ABC-type branched-subunit amino acid transport system ATPase component
LPALRIRGLYLAVTTLAFAVAMDSFFLNPVNFNSVLPQAVTPPVLWRRFDLGSTSTGQRNIYYLTLGLLVAVVAAVAGLRSARAGRAMIATRDNERAAAAMAVPTTRVKLVGFVLAGAICGLAGGLHVLALDGEAFHTFEPSQSLLVFSMAVIGGLSSIAGALLGVAVIEFLAHAFPQYQLIITGAGLLVVLIVLPGGLGQAVQQVRDVLLRLVARRRGIALEGDLVDLLASRASEKEATAEPVPAAAGGELAADQDSGALLRCRDVRLAYGGTKILFGIDLDVHEGEVVALLGTNGAGKSTLLKAITGLAATSHGSVHLDGRDIGRAKPDQLARAGIAMMPGGRGIFPSLTVRENMRLAAWTIRSDHAVVDAATDRLLAMFPVLASRRDQTAGTLSGGEQQQLSLSMALMTRPRLLLIDELSLGLAPTVVGQLIEVVRQLNRDGVTVVVVEQSVNVALELAERAVFLEKGQVRFAGRTADLLERPDVLRSVFIAGAAAAAPAVPPRRGRRRAGELAAERAAAAASRTRLEAITAAEVVLATSGLSLSFGGIRALRSVDLELRKGEIVGLIGHNGAGKTTLFDCISGFLRPDAGQVLLGGHDVTAMAATSRAWIGLGRSFQEARLYGALTVAETVSVALERHLASRGVVAAALRLPASTDSEDLVAAKVAELLALTGLSGYGERLIGELSTGTRRIVELACVLAQEPAVLLLDEPSGGVAQKETEALGPMLRRVQEQTGCSMLVIEHDMPLLSGLCDRLVAFELGETIAEGTPAHVLAHPRVVASYLGTDQVAVNRSGATGRPAAREPAGV